MSISPKVLEQVRERAAFACEYCGVSELDSGGLLTVDHFQPLKHFGSESLDNLVYACFRCNVYKAAYWPDGSSDIDLWNPRSSKASAHFVELDDGRTVSLTAIGAQTIKVLRLNRPYLISYRRGKSEKQIQQHLIQRIIEIVLARTQAETEHHYSEREQFDLLSELRDILRNHLP